VYVTIFVFDASAVFRHHDDEAGADRMDAILAVCARGFGEMCISAVQWGEIAAVQRRRLDAQAQDRLLASLIELQLRVIPVTAERAERAAAVRVDRKISNADSYAIELAMDSPDHLLVTADYDFKAVADLAQIEFLPQK
jgi:predicted nucleic acid-binding protein